MAGALLQYWCVLDLARLRVILPTLALASLPGCFYVPPIGSAPEEPDTPPFVLGFDPDLVVDLRSGGDLRLSVDAVYDFNEPEDIEWSFRMFLRPDDPATFTLASGRLLLRETQSFIGITEYEGPEIRLSRCPTLDEAAGDADLLFIELVLVDEIPNSQRQDGFEQFEVVESWRIKLTGECDQ